MKRTFRLFLFLSVCLSTRFTIAVLTSVFDLSGIWCIPFFFVGFGFINSARIKPQVGFFGGPCWWEDWRIFHAVMWLMAGICVAANLAYVATGFLAIDASMGAIIWCATPNPNPELPTLDQSLQT